MVTTLFEFDTEYSADSVEFCPISEFKNYFCIGTYQVEETNQYQNCNEEIGLSLGLASKAFYSII
jgi:hypothetical protein